MKVYHGVDKPAILRHKPPDLLTIQWITNASVFGLFVKKNYLREIKPIKSY